MQRQSISARPRKQHCFQKFLQIKYDIFIVQYVADFVGDKIIIVLALHVAYLAPYGGSVLG